MVWAKSRGLKFGNGKAKSKCRGKNPKTSDNILRRNVKMGINQINMVEGFVG